MAHRNKKLTKMFNEQAGICAFCQECMTLDLNEDNTATIDHIIPQAKGGTNQSENLIAACFICNQEKADDSLRHFLSKCFKGIDVNV